MLKKDNRNRDKLAEAIIADISEKIRSGTLVQGEKLESEGNLSRQYQANIYSVRKALRKLKQCGLIYSVPKFGVFVGNYQKTEKEPLNNQQDQMTMSVIHLKMHSYLPIQKEIWAFAGDLSFKEHQIKLEYSYSNDASDIPFDLEETSIISDRDDKVDLLKYLPDMFEVPPLPSHPRSMPIYYGGPVLIYNENLMKKLGIPLPTYKNFAEQKEYFFAALEKIRSKGYSNPCTMQNFLCIFSCDVQRDLIKDLCSDTIEPEDFASKYKAVFEKACSFYRAFQFSDLHDPDRAKVDFSLGKTPFLLGLAYNYAELKQQIKTFSIGGAMMYAMDNRFNSVQLSLSLNADTRDFMAAVSTMQLFQQQPIQNKLAEAGLIPLQQVTFSKLPYSLKIPLKKMSILSVFNTAEEYYVMEKIISTALWRYVNTACELDEFCRKICIFSRAYIKIQQDRNNNKER